MRLSTLASALFLLVLPAVSPGQTTITVTFDAALRAEPATGRLVVYLVREGSKIPPSTAPADGPFWQDPQPMYGTDVAALAPGVPATIDQSATAFPVPLNDLPQGTYRLQAVLDVRSDHSSWRRETGNLYSDPITVTLGAADGPISIPITLTKLTTERTPPESADVQYFSIPSKLLSDFYKKETLLRAGVSLPINYDPQRHYAAIYDVPGFGGDHTGVGQAASRRRAAAAETPEGILARNCFYIVLDPESANGHTLFANSANNGPRADALIQELIPALEAKYSLIPQPSARLLRGHSSGGWSTLWLGLNYPDTFGAVWSTSPDPVDFHRLQLTDIYTQPNMYTAGAGDTTSYRSRGQEKMTVRQENLMEEVLGPRNTSGQQWDSWFAVWGPRGEDGHPAPLFNPQSGEIDRAVAEQYKKYDIAELLRTQAGLYGPIFLQRIRLAVGDQDNFYLNEAVALLKADLEKLSFFHLPEGAHGWIKIIPGVDHGSIFGTAELRAIPQDMVDHLTRRGHIAAK